MPPERLEVEVGGRDAVSTTTRALLQRAAAAATSQALGWLTASMAQMRCPAGLL